MPLLEPFTISRASVLRTRAVLVRARVSDGEREVVGLGEAALAMGSTETEDELLEASRAVARSLVGRTFGDREALTVLLDESPPSTNVARAGLAEALFDAAARLEGATLCRYLGGGGTFPLETDITLPIADPAHLAELARGYASRGFSSFKIKVGIGLDADMAALGHLARALPAARVRLDANMALDGEAAARLVDGARALGLALECFEQPCPRDDFEGMRRVRAQGVPVVADEAVRDEADLDRLCEEEAVDGINLKLMKMGGPDRCLLLGRRAKERGLSLMVGAMIESRLGLTAMAHVACALGGVSWVDLDTAFLLRTDPWKGGLLTDGPRLELPDACGLGIASS